MEYATRFVDPYTTREFPSYSNAFTQHTQDMHATSSWIVSLNLLHDQKGYLDNLLSKKAITLNALRDRQTRNERAVSLNPTPQSKRKKIHQNRYRTNKTIETCENEERVILESLQICENNIQALELLVNPPRPLSSTAVAWTPSHSFGSDATGVSWDGWTEETSVSPFIKGRVRSLPVDDIPPETRLGKSEPNNVSNKPTRRAPPLPRSLQVGVTTLLPPVPPNTAASQFPLSPEAAVFEPGVSQYPYAGDEAPIQLDKLSISGLLVSKCMLQIQNRRFSDIAIGQLFGKLESERPAVQLIRAYQSWASSPEKPQNGKCLMELMKRTNSV